MNASITPIRDRIGMGLMLLAALGALFAFANAVVWSTQAGPATQQVEWWRAVSFLMFVSVFVLLAFGPRRYPFLWELVILNKAILTVVELILIRGGAANALSSAVVDAALVFILIAAYVLVKGYLSWKR